MTYDLIDRLSAYKKSMLDLIKIMTGECTFEYAHTIELVPIVNVLSETIKMNRIDKKAILRLIETITKEMDNIRSYPRGTLGDEYYLWKDKVNELAIQRMNLKTVQKKLDTKGYNGLTISDMKHIITVITIARELKELNLDDFENIYDFMKVVKSSKHLNEKYSKYDILKISKEVYNLLKYKMV